MSGWLFDLTWVEYVVLGYFVKLNGVYLLTSFLAYGQLRDGIRRNKTHNLQFLLTSAGLPGVTLLLPCFNEEATCVDAVHGALGLRYPEYEMIVINDGSTDRTLAVLTIALDLVPSVRPDYSAAPSQSVRGWYRSRTYPKVWVLDKVNGGKADALNAGLRACVMPLFCTLDADSVMDPDALVRLVYPFLDDVSTVASGGHVRIINGCTVNRGQLMEVKLPAHWLERFQVLEYFRGFLQSRIGWTSLGAPMIISGAFGVFRRSLVVAAGGYDPAAVGEDMELVVRLHRYCREHEMSYRMAFQPDAVAWTRCPTGLMNLLKQRSRWQRGLMEVIWTHRVMFGNLRYGLVGLYAFPFFVIYEFGGVFVEMVGYAMFFEAWWVGGLQNGFVLLFLLMVFVVGTCISLLAIFLEGISLRFDHGWRDLLRLYVVAVAEPFIYSPLMLGGRLLGVAQVLLGNRGWGRLIRRRVSVPVG